MFDLSKFVMEQNEQQVEVQNIRFQRQVLYSITFVALLSKSGGMV